MLFPANGSWQLPGPPRAPLRSARCCQQRQQRHGSARGSIGVPNVIPSCTEGVNTTRGVNVGTGLPMPERAALTGDSRCGTGKVLAGRSPACTTRVLSCGVTSGVTIPEPVVGMGQMHEVALSGAPMGMATSPVGMRDMKTSALALTSGKSSPGEAGKCTASSLAPTLVSVASATSWVELARGDPGSDGASFCKAPGSTANPPGLPFCCPGWPPGRGELVSPPAGVPALIVEQRDSAPEGTGVAHASTQVICTAGLVRTLICPRAVLETEVELDIVLKIGGVASGDPGQASGLSCAADSGLAEEADHGVTVAWLLDRITADTCRMLAQGLAAVATKTLCEKGSCILRLLESRRSPMAFVLPMRDMVANPPPATVEALRETALAPVPHCCIKAST